MDASPSPQHEQQQQQQEQNRHNNNSNNNRQASNSASPPSNLPPLWSLDDFEFGQQIGEGRFGTVYLAREKSSGYKVAVKAVRKDDVIRLDMKHQLEREVRLQKYASRHPHVLSMFACFWDKKFVYLVMEYCEGGDLSRFCKNAATTTNNSSLPASSSSSPSPNRRPIDEATVACWSRQLIDAVAFLHAHRLVHRDIKPENIMLKRGRVKLGDFTWCVGLGQQPPYDRRRTICGTLDYLSPELVSHMPYDQQLDVWSIGVVVFELLVGVPPFEHPRPVDTCMCIQRGEFTIPPGSMSAAAEDFLRSVLVVEPSQRPSCKDLLKHPWIESAPVDVPKSFYNNSNSSNRRRSVSASARNQRSSSSSQLRRRQQQGGQQQPAQSQQPAAPFINPGNSTTFLNPFHNQTGMQTTMLMTTTDRENSNNNPNNSSSLSRSSERGGAPQPMTTAMMNGSDHSTLVGGNEEQQHPNHNNQQQQRRMQQHQQHNDDDVSRALELSGIGDEEEPASVSRSTVVVQ